MRRSALIAVLLPIALAATALPTWAVLVVDRNAARIPGLQSLANASCGCARRAADAKGEDACWHHFERITHTDHRNPTGGTFCYPLSEAMIWLGDDEDHSITLGYGVVPGRNLYLCSKEEAIVGEAIWYRKDAQGTTPAELNQSLHRADAALIRFAEALKRGEPLEKLKPAMGCVTGYPR